MEKIIKDKQNYKQILEQIRNDKLKKKGINQNLLGTRNKIYNDLPFVDTQKVEKMEVKPSVNTNCLMCTKDTDLCLFCGKNKNQQCIIEELNRDLEEHGKELNKERIYRFGAQTTMARQQETIKQLYKDIENLKDDHKKELWALDKRNRLKEQKQQETIKSLCYELDSLKNKKETETETETVIKLYKEIETLNDKIDIFKTPSERRFMYFTDKENTSGYLTRSYIPTHLKFSFIKFHNPRIIKQQTFIKIIKLENGVYALENSNQEYICCEHDSSYGVRTWIDQTKGSWNTFIINVIDKYENKCTIEIIDWKQQKFIILISKACSEFFETKEEIKEIETYLKFYKHNINKYFVETPREDKIFSFEFSKVYWSKDFDEIIFLDNDMCAIKKNNKYLCCDPNGNFSPREWIGGWETFKLTKNNNGISLESAHGHIFNYKV